MKVIYIGGLYHSGSTLLDVLLSEQINSVGLGEIYKLWQDGPEEYCSCGSRAEECEFWSELLPSRHLEIRRFYEMVFKKVIEDYGEDIVVIDSSKVHPLFGIKDGFKSLPFLMKIENIDLRIFHLIRHPLSWTRRIAIRKNRFEVTNIFSKLKFTLFVRYAQWIYAHRRFIKFLSHNRLRHGRIFYHDLMRFNYMDYGLVKDLPPRKLDLISHIVVGNPSRHRFREGIKYDTRWLSTRLTFTDGFFICFFRRMIFKIMTK